MPVHRRDSAGGHEFGPSWESLVERQIREAMESGAFDDLPYRGERLPLEDDSAAGEWALAHLMLRNAGIAPPWIQADKEARGRLAERDRLLERASRGPLSEFARRRLRADLDRIVGEANRAIERLNAEAPTDRQHRRRLDPEAERRALELLLAGEGPAEQAIE